MVEDNKMLNDKKIARSVVEMKGRRKKLFLNKIIEDIIVYCANTKTLLSLTQTS